MHTAEITPHNISPTRTINQWILHRATETFARYQEEFGKKEFSLALSRVDQLFWQDFCDNYLELIKPQLFKPEEFSPHEVTEIKQTLYQVGLQLLQLYAPFLPFVTEKLYQEMYQAAIKIDSLHQTQFSAIQQHILNPAAARNIDMLLPLIAGIRKVKSTHQLSLGAALSELTIATTNAELKKLIEQHAILLKGISRAHAITTSSTNAESSITIKDQEVHMYLNADTL
jgi:valyl-tRNA synthetase